MELENTQLNVVGQHIATLLVQVEEIFDKLAFMSLLSSTFYMYSV